MALYKVKTTSGRVETRDSISGKVVHVSSPQKVKGASGVVGSVVYRDASGNITKVDVRDKGGGYTRYSGGGGGGVSSPKAQAGIQEVEKAKAEQLERQTPTVKQQPQLPKRETQQDRFLRETRKDIQPKSPVSEGYQVKFDPYLEERQTGSFEHEGKTIPITGLFYVDPEDVSPEGERKATPEEREYFEKQTSQLQASSKKTNIPLKKFKDAVYGGLTSLGEKTRQSLTDPLATAISSGITKVERRYDVDLPSTFKEAKQKARETTEFLKSKGAPDLLVESGEFLSGVGIGMAEDVRKRPLKNVLLYGAGAGIGFGLGAIGKGVASGGSLLASKTGIGVLGHSGTIFKLGQIGVGGYLGGRYALGVGKQILGASSSLERGMIFGTSAKDIGITGFGFAKGRQLFTKAQGYFSTRGRTEIPIERLVSREILEGKKSFPTAPKGQQYRLFQQTAKRFPELSKGKPGAFHTTPDKFWNKQLTPKPGSSELPGLYGSSDVSIYFSKISGSGKYKLLPKFKDLLSTDGKPGIAYLKPSKFRITGYSTADPYQVGGKTFRYGFGKPVKQGYADLPLMKTEIESIFRTDAGSYNLGSADYFTTYKGVRIPIDVFEFGGKPSVNIPTSAGGFGRGGLGGGSYSISSLGSSPIITPSSLAVGLYSSQGVSKYKPSSVSYYPKKRATKRLVYDYGITRRKSKVSKSYKSPISKSPYSSLLSSSTTSSYIYNPSRTPRRKPPTRFKGVPHKYKVKRKPQILRQPTIYQPSLTASVFRIRGKGIKLGKLGYSPFTIRGLRKRRVRI